MRKRKRPFSDVPERSPNDLDAAREARQRSTDEYLRTVERNPEVRQVAARLRKRREDNHFAALLVAAGWQPTR